MTGAELLSVAVAGGYLVALCLIVLGRRRHRDQATDECRSEPRFATAWSGRYRTGSNTPWRPCTVLGVSRTGATLELDGIASSVRVRGMLDLVLASAGYGEGVRLAGRIRHQRRLSGGRVRVGTEFDNLSAAEADLLELLIRLKQS